MGEEKKRGRPIYKSARREMFYNNPGEVKASKWKSQNQELGMCMSMSCICLFSKAYLFLIIQISTFSLTKTVDLFLGIESKVFEQHGEDPMLLRRVSSRTWKLSVSIQLQLAKIGEHTFLLITLPRSTSKTARHKGKLFGHHTEFFTPVSHWGVSLPFLLLLFFLLIHQPYQTNPQGKWSLSCKQDPALMPLCQSWMTPMLKLSQQILPIDVCEAEHKSQDPRKINGPITPEPENFLQSNQVLLQYWALGYWEYCWSPGQRGDLWTSRTAIFPYSPLSE